VAVPRCTRADLTHTHTHTHTDLFYFPIPFSQYSPFLQTGCTPLHVAAGNDHTAAIQVLIAAGANVNAVDEVRYSLISSSKASSKQDPHWLAMSPEDRSEMLGFSQRGKGFGSFLKRHGKKIAGGLVAAGTAVAAAKGGRHVAGLAGVSGADPTGWYADRRSALFPGGGKVASVSSLASMCF
jgi:hypothetical protein